MLADRLEDVVAADEGEVRATSSNPAPVIDSAVSSPGPPYFSATGASSAPCGAIRLVRAASTASAVNSGTVNSTLPTTSAAAIANDFLARLAHRGRELAQRFQPRVRQPGARETAGGLDQRICFRCPKLPHRSAQSDGAS